MWTKRIQVTKGKGPFIIYDKRFTKDTDVVMMNPRGDIITGDVLWETYNGYVKISGDFSDDGSVFCFFFDMNKNREYRSEKEKYELYGKI